MSFCKVSVIVPVYGTSQYIEKCMESLLNQTLMEMQFILIDDFTPDDSIEKARKIIDSSIRKDQFLFIKPQRNLGAGLARNFALPYVKGEYVAFVDSDDTIESNMFQNLYNEAMSFGGADICYCHAYKDYDDGRKSEILRNPIVEGGAFSVDKKKFFLKNYVSHFTTFIYKYSFIRDNNIVYPNGQYSEDSYFEFCNLILARTVSCVDKPYYHYFIRKSSLCTTKKEDKYKTKLYVFGEMLKFAKNKGLYDIYKSEIDYIYIKKAYLISVFSYISNSFSPQNEVLKEILRNMKQELPDYKDNIYYKNNLKIKTLMKMLEVFPSVSKCVLSFFLRKSNLVL